MLCVDGLHEKLELQKTRSKGQWSMQLKIRRVLSVEIHLPGKIIVLGQLELAFDVYILHGC